MDREKAIIILDGNGGQGGASRRAGGRDERPPQISSPSVAVNTATNRRWIPPSAPKRDAVLSAYNDRNDAIFRKVRGILNKLTPDKFDKLSLELLNVGIDSQLILKGIILLIFEKALDEPKYSSLYANLCARLCEDSPNFEPPSTNITTFRRLLLNKCQDEFENRSRATEVFNKDGPPLTAEEEEQFLIARSKMLGNIKFIGELGKLEMLHEGILHKCIKQLLEKKKKIPVKDMAENMECLCQILRTVGKRLDQNKAKLWMDQYFERIKVYKDNPAFPSRIRFFLQDVIELRMNNWKPRKILADTGPKTIQQIREEAAREFGIYLPPGVGAGPPGMNVHMSGMGMSGDLFGHHQMNGVTSPGARGGMSDVFSSMPPHFMGSGVGTGPGVIPLDTFSYHGNMGRRGNQQNISFPNNHYGNRRQDRSDRGNDREEGSSPKFNNRDRDRNDEGGKKYKDRNQEQNRDRNQELNRDRDRNNRDRDNQEHRDRDYNERNNYQRRERDRERETHQTAGGRELPPRFRKQQLQQGGGVFHPGQTGAPVPLGNDQPMFTMQPQQIAPARPPNQAEVVNLRPAKNFTPMLRPNIPSMLPKSAQASPVSIGLRGSGSGMEGSPIPNPLVQKQANVIIRKVEAPEKPKNSHKKPPTHEELKEALESMLTKFLKNGDYDEAVLAVKEMRAPNKYIPEMVTYMVCQSLDVGDTQRENVSKLIARLKEAGIVNSNNFMDGFQAVVEQMGDLESSIPLVKSYVARVAAEAVGAEIITLSELAEPMEGGVRYPLFLLCLQQISKVRDKEWLLQIFNESKIDLLTMLPECDRSKERLNEILEDRCLNFMFPLLRVQSDLWKQIRADPTPSNIYKWIKENVDSDLRESPGFINIVVSNILRYIVGETTAREGFDLNNVPTKAQIEMEKDLMTKFQGVLQMFLHDKPDLQITAVYAVQVLCYNHGFPKGMLLRMFMNLYDQEVIEEEVFLRWKEEVNEEYLGKGKALFQVNTWLTWLEQAEEESEEEEEENEEN